MALLELRDVHAYYGKIHALKGVSLSVEEGEIVTLIGANGAGKSTTLKTISGLLRPRAGAILFQGEHIEGRRPHEIVSLGVCQSPEGRRVFSRMTVMENLEMGAFQREDRSTFQEDLDRVFELFPRLHERRTQKAGTLSGGEQQQLAIARALIGNPALLLLDEPSEGIQPSIVQLICDALKAVRDELGSTIVFVEQNLDTILSLSERAYVIEKGRVLRHLDAAEVADADRVRESLLL